jgi:hypothetical protein
MPRLQVRNKYDQVEETLATRQTHLSLRWTKDAQSRYMTAAA